MKIAFNKVARENSYSLKVESEQFSVDANFDIVPKTASMVLCKLTFSGEIQTICNRCGNEITQKVDEIIELLISDGVFDGFDKNFDVVEVLDGFVDFDEIIHSELELIFTNYYNCGSCKDIKNIEF